MIKHDILNEYILMYIHSNIARCTYHHSFLCEVEHDWGGKWLRIGRENLQREEIADQDVTPLAFITEKEKERERI